MALTVFHRAPPLIHYLHHQPFSFLSHRRFLNLSSTFTTWNLKRLHLHVLWYHLETAWISLNRLFSNSSGLDYYLPVLYSLYSGNGLTLKSEYVIVQGVVSEQGCTGLHAGERRDQSSCGSCVTRLRTVWWRAGRKDGMCPVFVSQAWSIACTCVFELGFSSQSGRRPCERVRARRLSGS